MAPQFLSPGVFLEEVQGKSGQIPVTSTATFAIAGFSPRGPEGVAFSHASPKEFFDRFGSYSSKSFNAYAASAYFANGGSQLIFVRQLHSDATYASGAFAGTWDVKASGRGVWANDGTVQISGNPSFYDRSSATYSRFDVTVQLVDPSSGLLGVTETFEALDFTDPGDPDYVLAILESSSEDIGFTSNTGGVPAQLQPVTHTALSVGTGDGLTTAFTHSFAGQTPLAETTLQILVNSVVVAEDDGDGNMVGVNGGPTIGGTINYTSGALAISISPAPANTDPITANVLTAPATSVSITLEGGADGSTVVSSDVVGGVQQAAGTGIYALDAFPIQMSLALPDFIGDQASDSALLAYAETRRDIVCILQPPAGSSAANAVKYKRNTLASSSSFGAMYWPWVKQADPLQSNRPKLVPAVGHIAGRYAFTDINENVGKAPAGVNRGQLSLVLGLERNVTQGDRDTVYPAQINPIRSDAEVGTAIWGNKTLQVIGDFTDVNIRRTFIFLEKAQHAGLVDIVFENIGPVTWALVSARLNAFLENQYLQGVIGSGVADKAQAFKVICDVSNNPPSVQQAQEIVIDEFIKPNLAAEFIFLRIQRVFDASQT